MKLAFVHHPGRLARLEAARAGTAPTEFLFGAVELERAGHDVVHHEVDPAAPVPRLGLRLVDQNAGRGLLPPHLSWAGLAATRALLPQLRAADVVVATTTGTAMALGTWRRAGLLRRPLVGIVAGLLNRPWRRARRLSTLPLLRAMEVLLYGPGELPGLLALDGRLRGRVHVDLFGVDTSFWTPAPHGPARDVVAIGNDGLRDWTTLVRAAASIAAPVRILTGRPRPVQLPENVRWEEADWHRRVLSDEEVRDAYRGAAAVVVPLRDSPQPSGQSVTLQAMACGAPVVLSRTAGLWAEESLHNVRLVPPGEPARLAAAVNELLEDRAAARALAAAALEDVRRDGSVEGFAQRLEAICRAAAERG